MSHHKSEAGKIPLDEVVITRAIIERFSRKMLDALELDVAVVGGGPAGLVAAHDLARASRRVALFERKLCLGGGMWGGGMMFNEIVVQEEGKAVLDEFGIRTRPIQKGYHSADAVESVSTLCSRAARAGATIFNLMTVEDLVVRQGRVVGLVLNWSAVEKAGLHVDPLTIRSTFVIDATGHDAEVVRFIERKGGESLHTPSGKVMGEKSLWADVAEDGVLENTREVYPGIVTAGMAANAAFGDYRMGPVFGGMLMSGRKAAAKIDERLGGRATS